MTDAELKQLRDLMRAATPGPLTVMARNAGEQCVAVVNQLELVPPNGVELAHEKADADFLAAAVNALPGLLDEVERLRADAARYRRLIERHVVEVSGRGDLGIRFDCDFDHWNDVSAALDAEIARDAEQGSAAC